MTEQELAEVNEIGAIAISHTALLTALFGLLQERNILDGDDLNALFDTAQRGLELAEPSMPSVIGRARRVLDESARNLAKGPGR